MNTKLSGNQIQSLQAALLAAFPTAADLRRMVRFQLNENLDAIVGGNNQTELIFNLTEWAEAQGRLPEFINGAVAANPGNLKLQEWMESYIQTQTRSDINIDSIEYVDADARLRHVQPINSSGDDNIIVGAISSSDGIAIGEGAQSNVTYNYHDNQTPDRKWQDIFDSQLASSLKRDPNI